MSRNKKKLSPSCYFWRSKGLRYVRIQRGRVATGGEKHWGSSTIFGMEPATGFVQKNFEYWGG